MATGFLRNIFSNNKEVFFPLFEDLAMVIVRSADQLTGIIEHPDEEEAKAAYLKIRDLEASADSIVHRVMAAVNGTINTPFDREDIQRLMSAMDDVIDGIYGASQQIRLYRPVAPLSQLHELNRVMVAGVEQMRIGVFELRKLKQSKEIGKARNQIRELEQQADEIYHQLISDLFEKEADPIELVKHKEIMESLERITDRIDDVADVFKTIMLKAA